MVAHEHAKQQLLQMVTRGVVQVVVDTHLLQVVAWQ
jgi:hypothetical protein